MARGGLLFMLLGLLFVFQDRKVNSVKYESGKAYTFNSCGAEGLRGPNQKLCDLAYGEDFKVQVIETGPYKGVQTWQVPETSFYSVTAVGASGGLGAQNRKSALNGDYVHAKINFTKGEKLYLLIGQEGGSACSSVSLKDHPELQKQCLLQPTINTSGQSTQSGFDKSLIGGAGGGGGATVVFKIDSVTNLPVVLIVAGGGGGLSSLIPSKMTEPNSTGSHWTTSDVTLRAGEGGSIHTSAELPTGGGALLNDAVGGRVCLERFWDTTGGFGGGGGPCLSGGGGGGYVGGNVSDNDSPYDPGQSGSSYAIDIATEVNIKQGIRFGTGWVEIVMPLSCPSCAYFCIWDDIKLRKYHCLCPSNTTLDTDGIHCIGPATIRQKAKSLPSTGGFGVGHWLAIFLPGVIIIATICSLYYLLTVKRKNRKTKSDVIKLERIMNNRQNGNGTIRQQTRPLSQNQMNPVMHFNPNYDAVVTKCCEQILVELPRRNLKLSRLIGHGAFGEVYMGVLANVTHLTEELTVAVKTLPALCTEQTELDFLMEAVILSKFHHPNIVHLIGVCFDSIPRYIVLEILEGGDLKTFLRESRPTPTRCPDLTIRDLLCLCLDIARACHHLEEKHFIHRDIAARNCLLTSKGPSRKAKIADFGMARDIYRSDYYKKTGRALLPVKWMPPEAFLDGIFTAKTDIWSYGILLWEIFSLGHMPYPGCSNEEVMQSVTVGGRLTPPDGCPATVYEIMNYCWSGLAEERPTFSTLVSSVEKCLEDDDVVSRGLPAFYQPAVPGTQGLRLPSNPMSTSISTTRVRECLDASSNYLEPLIPASSLSSNQLNNLDGSFEFSPNA